MVQVRDILTVLFLVTAASKEVSGQGRYNQTNRVTFAGNDWEYPIDNFFESW